MLDLAVVMPVYNEEDCIVEVVSSWHRLLSGLGIAFRLIVLNDGSTDRTLDRLQVFREAAEIEVVDNPNRGHGPTILAGYRRACELAAWVFQCDSDNEMTAEHFPALWAQRAAYDALFGYRTGRRQPAGRKLISAGSRLTVRALFGPGIVDVNTPYRLLRAPLLAQLLPQIPADTFAPNVIIAGAFARAQARICNHPVPHETRATGTVSLIKWRLVRAAARAFWQTVRCRPPLMLPDPPGKARAHGG